MINLIQILDIDEGNGHWDCLNSVVKIGDCHFLYGPQTKSSRNPDDSNNAQVITAVTDHVDKDEVLFHSTEEMVINYVNINVENDDEELLIRGGV